jgi:hypothetical protein
VSGSIAIMARDEKSGWIDMSRASLRLGITKGQLAETAGFRPGILQRSDRANAVRTQSRVAEMLEIIARVAPWTGGERQAFAWYRAEPIPAFGDRTAESLVKDGKAAALRDFLDHLALGGYA